MQIIQAILTKNPCYKTGKKMRVKGIMLHSAECPQPSAKVFIHNWNRGSCDNKCAHAFVDAVDDAVYQTLPWNHKGRHSGRHPVTKQSANEGYIGIIFCEPAQIKYTGEDVFELTDESYRDSAVRSVKMMYSSAIELCSLLCSKFNLDPLKDIISHKEGYSMGIASNRGDPEHLWDLLGLPYSMDVFRTDVMHAMIEEDAGTEFEAETNPDPVYEDDSKTDKKPAVPEPLKERQIQIDVENLRIRSGPGTNFDPIGKYTGIGIFTITEIQNGSGSEKGWGKLKNIDGWVCLDYVMVL